MKPERQIEPEELDALAIGAGILGTGGGTHPYLELLALRQLYRQGHRVRLIAADALDDTDQVAELGYMGAPLVTKERLPDPKHIIRPVKMMEAYVGKPFNAVMPSEVGAENGLLPLIVGAMMDLPVVDADTMGRAFPEMQMSSFVINGLPLVPFAMADIRANEHFMLKAESPIWVERLNRRLCTEMGAMAATCRPPRSGLEVKKYSVKGSTSRAIRLGKAVLDARQTHSDPLDAIIGGENGILLFTGKVVDVERRTSAGFVTGKAEIHGEGEFLGQSFVVDFQNEFTVGVIDGKRTIMVPDLICILDASSGEAIGTETIRYGLRVGIVAIAADKVLKGPEGLAYVGPRAFGYDFDFVSPFASVA